MESKIPNPIEDVSLTSPNVIPKDQDVLISWKSINQEILGYEICVGTVAGVWDVCHCEVGKDVREIKLPGLPYNLTPLFVEFSYTIPAETVHSIPSHTMHDHESSESVLVHEAWEISRV